MKNWLRNSDPEVPSKRPRNDVVTVDDPFWLTPRIDMHMCLKYVEGMRGRGGVAGCVSVIDQVPMPKTREVVSLVPNSRCFNHHSNATGTSGPSDCLRNLLGEPFLNLKALREAGRQANELREANNFSLGEVSDVNLSVEGQHVMFTHGVELDVLHNDHFSVRRREQGVGNYILRLLLTRGTGWGRSGGQFALRGRAAPRFITASRTNAYPLVRAKSAFAIRIGVFTRPSRSGSSPMHSNSTRQASAIRSKCPSTLGFDTSVTKDSALTVISSESRQFTL